MLNIINCDLEKKLDHRNGLGLQKRKFETDEADQDENVLILSSQNRPSLTGI